MQKAKIKLKIEVSREFEDYMGEQYIEQVVMRVANRIVSELRWQIENPGLATEERFTIDKPENAERLPGSILDRRQPQALLRFPVQSIRPS